MGQIAQSSSHFDAANRRSGVSGTITLGNGERSKSASHVDEMMDRIVEEVPAERFDGER
jgi:hypothetical protein